MNKYQNIEDYFPLVEHKLNMTTDSPGFQIYETIRSFTFADVAVEGLDEIVQFKKEHPEANIVYLARHLSEFDWTEIQRNLVKHDLDAIIQAGANLFIGPMDIWLRQAGGFKVFREPTKIYHEKWLANWIKGFIDKDLGLDLQDAIDISKEKAEEIYRAYVDKLLLEGWDLLVFPEYSRTGKSLKYGRSYTGELLPFSPLVLTMPVSFQRAHPERDLYFVCVANSFERVVEDQIFHTLEVFKRGAFSKKLVYPADYLFNLTHRVLQRKGRVHLSFGEPVSLKELMPLRRLGLANRMRDNVGQESVFYPTQLLAYSLRESDFSKKIPIGDVKDAISQTLEDVDMLGKRYTQYLGTAEKILEEAHYQFWQPPTRRIVRLDGPFAKVYRPDILSQYANHNRHLLEEQLL